MYYFSTLALTLNELEDGVAPRTAGGGQTSGSWSRASGRRPTLRSRGWRRSSAACAARGRGRPALPTSMKRVRRSEGVSEWPGSLKQEVFSPPTEL